MIESSIFISASVIPPRPVLVARSAGTRIFGVWAVTNNPLRRPYTRGVPVAVDRGVACNRGDVFEAVSVHRQDSEDLPVVEFDAQPAVARVETDRFCDACGYNLRTQPVRRDARTDLLLCRCPECGRVHPARDTATAGHVWLKRLGSLLLFVWILVVLWAGVGLFAGQVGMIFVLLEELTTYRSVAVSTPSTQPASTITRVGPDGSTVMTISAGSVTISGPGPTPTWRRGVREHREHDRAFILLVRGISFGLGFLLAMMAGVCLYHWRRWGYLLLVILFSIGPAVIAWYVWFQDWPYLREWSEPHIAAQAAAHFAGGLAGILLGRPVGRLIITLALPPRVRQGLAFLWLVDGKPPPALATERC